ncbi:MAG: hypothetical protein ACT6RZ_10280 [Methylophilus sp.]|uniref:hypothetical protein n=1 Tax=Methylophilus sp. TaxID=29541 RepID=UPI0040357508
MKKIDFHIHTVPTVSDSIFTFSLDVFQKYVNETHLDAVAITNHDLFDAEQFRLIERNLGITVFPGIEINLEKGHVLIITESTDVEDFVTKTNLVSQRITKKGDFITIEEFETFFGNLNKYLVIPHYDKRPSLSNETLDKMKSYVAAGEVDSAKKFIRNIKDPNKLTPVLFSDLRIKVGLDKFPTRQTFIDCGDISLSAIKLALQDKKKVTLSENDGNKLWQVFTTGQMLSTGLNILIGERSSGKTHTLNEIYSNIDNVKYIQQFSLVQQNEASYERDFKTDVERKRSVFIDEYLLGFKKILDDIMNVDLISDDREVDSYLSTLLKSAEEIDRNDAFSNAALFSELPFPIGNSQTLKELIESVRQVIENIEFKIIIEKHLEAKSLKSLASELIKLLWEKTLESSKKKLINELIIDIKKSLQIRTSATQIEDVDLYKIILNKKRVRKFKEITNLLKTEAVISEENIQGFRIEAKKEPFTGAGEIRSTSGGNAAFSEAFKDYANPYMYLRALMSNENLTLSELYKLFVKINYRILNKDGFEVSGGERSEFRLLQEISDAKNYDLLLIDEPESSFDNLFLKSDVNQILKKLSEFMPVVVVTHNSTVGASIGADYILYTRKEIENEKPAYRVYSGYPTDKKLFSTDQKFISSHEIMMNSLEAGVEAYNNRRLGYEAIKD